MSEENAAVPAPAAAPKRPRDGRFPAMLVSGVLAAVLAIVAILVPVPYVIESPGPAINTIGKVNGEPIITVTGQKSFPGTGTLDLTTVHMFGGLPESPVNIFQVLRAWASNSNNIYPAELIYAPGTSEQTISGENAAQMTSSQEDATAAALKQLGIKYTTHLAVAAIPSGSASAGRLKPGDVLVSIDGTRIAGLTVIQDALAKGNGAPASLTIKRAGVESTVSVTPQKAGTGKYVLGIQVQYKFDFPFQVSFALPNVGGPSAGMMFSLGIIDTLTPGNLTGGRHFAGTGTIDPDGTVGPIGGIAQKMIGARQAGADYFLAPAPNCGDVVGHIPQGLQVIKVATLSAAYDAVKLIGSGQDGSKLPTCS
ncbi:PDZ domain-containing protein [Specibacter cremeus]|uniref:YlbL family protein n=1 Tax=Specibacter cremeus TaxID=1629051 RepID=UPI001F0BDC4E|nr:S16 family serine protease [Specibacter cremeus]